MTRLTDPQKIAEMLEAERAALARTVHDLTARFNTGADRTQAMGASAAPYFAMAERTVRRHPVAVALAGVGIAFLVFGTGRRSPQTVAETAADVAADLAKPPTHPDDPDTTQSWRLRAELLRERAAATINRIEEDANAYAADAADGVFARAASLRDFSSEKAAVVADLADGLTDTLRSGLNTLSDDAQTRIIAAREAAYARIAAMRAGTTKGGAPRAGGVTQTIQDHPLILGAVALALGAALAATLPRATGDTGFAAERDRLLADALRMMDEKRRQAGKFAASAADILTEAAKDSANTIADKARATADKVAHEAIAGLKSAKS